MSDYWQGIVDFFRNDPELAEWLTDEEARELQTISTDVMEIWKEAVLYQGFDIVKILKIMRRRYKDYMASITVETFKYEVDVKGTKKVFQFTNGEHMAKDLHFMFFIFSNRGSTWEKITQKSHDTVVDIMEMLKTKYDLNTDVHPAGATLPPDMVTIPRLSACFPTVYIDIYHARLAKELVKLSDLELDTNSSAAIICPALPSVIPPTSVEKKKNIHMVAFCVHVLVDDIIHKKDGKVTDLDSMLAYYKAAYNSCAVPVNSRIGYCKKVSLLELTTQKFKTMYTDIVAACEDKIRASRPSDPELDKTLAEIKSLKNMG